MLEHLKDNGLKGSRKLLEVLDGNLWFGFGRTSWNMVFTLRKEGLPVDAFMSKLIN